MIFWNSSVLPAVVLLITYEFGDIILPSGIRTSDGFLSGDEYNIFVKILYLSYV